MSNEKEEKPAVERLTKAPPGTLFDCAIIGGGPAGLSAAIYMGRMMRSVIVIDDHEGRSTWHQVNHNYLGFIDGVHATALREIGAAQSAQYGAVFLNARAEEVTDAGEGEKERFRILTNRGEVMSRTLVIANGVTDSFPEFEGSMECIGKSMFWCIICDGYESVGKRIVVLGHNNRAASLCLELLHFTEHVTLVSWDKAFDIDAAKMQVLKEHGINLYDSACSLYQCSAGQLSSVTLADNRILEVDRLFVTQWIEPNTQLAKQLNITVDEHGYIIADAEGATNVSGVYAAGDITRLHNHQVASAVHEGGMAASAANYYLYADWQKD